MIQIDVLSIPDLIVPKEQKTPPFITLIKCFLKPLDTLKGMFYTYFSKNTYELTWNGQVCMLEKLLNNEFDNTLERIEIANYETSESIYLYNAVENNEPTYVYNSSENEAPLYLYNELEMLQGFYIIIPASLVFDLDRLHALVKKYKLCSVRYSILYI